MYLDKHISKSYFFEVLEKRLREYEEAIFGIKKMPSMKQHLLTALLHHIQELKKNDALYNLFGKSFWGFGINNICDGSDGYTNPDVFEVKKIGGLNKHHEKYRYLYLLLFKIENDSLFVSTFIIDSCGYGHTSKINKEFKLEDFKNYEILKRGSAIIIELFFTSSSKPIRFQIDTYHFGGHLSGELLAKYYVENITKLASEHKSPQTQTLSEKNKDVTLDKKIDKVEINLRALIANTLIRAFAKEDYESLLTGDEKKQIKNCIKEYVGLHPNKKEDDFILLKDAIQFCNIEHLKKIILKEKNWEFFEVKFGEKDKVARYFEQLNNLRKAVKHSREITNLISFEGEAAIEWFGMVLSK